MFTKDVLSVHSQNQATIEERNEIIKPEMLEKVKKLVASKTSYDPFGNCNIDLLGVEEFTDKLR
ncbi:MAG: hypothetical protein H0U75_12745 [Legionella sp.]|nr:hypothetical protein [Legionella sp.]